MREFIEFKTVGGGAMDIEQAGTYYIPIDNILCIDDDASIGGDLDKLIIWANAVPSDASGAGELRYYKLQFNVNITNDTILAFNNALSAAPGGRKIPVQLPAGQEILGYQFQDIGIY